MNEIYKYHVFKLKMHVHKTDDFVRTRRNKKLNIEGITVAHGRSECDMGGKRKK